MTMTDHRPQGNATRYSLYMTLKHRSESSRGFAKNVAPRSLWQFHIFADPSYGLTSNGSYMSKSVNFTVLLARPASTSNCSATDITTVLQNNPIRDFVITNMVPIFA